MSDKVKKKIKEIENTISNKDEAAKAIELVAEVVNMFTDKLVEVTERQVRLEERLEEVFNMLGELEEEILENFNGEFEDTCPYCGETIKVTIPEEGEEFECPMCGKTIDMELLFEDIDGCMGCGGHNHGHHCDCGSCDDEDEE